MNQHPPRRDRRGTSLALSLLALTAVSAAWRGCSEGDDASGSAETAPAPAAISVHPLDTALLFPLPSQASEDRLLRANDAGALGELLPAYAFGTLPALGAGKNADLLPRLRVVSANVDPCFPSGVEGKVDAQGASQCRHQLRLIFQPVREDDDGTLTTDDVSVHTFYEMDAATFESLVRDLVAARGTGDLGDEAIDVHPIMRAEGPGGPFAATVQATFLAYGGAQNLAKVTFSGLRGGGIGWALGGVDFVGEKATDMIIPETTVTREEMINGGNAGDWDATVDPPTKFSQGLGVLLQSDESRTSDEATLRAAYVQALLIDNPETENHPGTVDCASCHLATPVRLWAERNLDFRPEDFAESYKNPRWNLENRSQTKENTQATRCFGYYGREVSISQRTINEAAAVADFVNTKILVDGGAR
jgi:hypothetical protein